MAEVVAMNGVEEDATSATFNIASGAANALLVAVRVGGPAESLVVTLGGVPPDFHEGGDQTDQLYLFLNPPASSTSVNLQYGVMDQPRILAVAFAISGAAVEGLTELSDLFKFSDALEEFEDESSIDLDTESGDLCVDVIYGNNVRVYTPGSGQTAGYNGGRVAQSHKTATGEQTTMMWSISDLNAMDHYAFVIASGGSPAPSLTISEGEAFENTKNSMRFRCTTNHGEGHVVFAVYEDGQAPDPAVAADVWAEADALDGAIAAQRVAVTEPGVVASAPFVDLDPDTFYECLVVHGVPEE